MTHFFNKKKLFTKEIQSLDCLIKAPLNNLISTFEDLEKLLEFYKENNLNIPENIYFCMTNFHTILYNNEETIDIASYNIKIDLNNLFFLDLLIMENLETLNYEYSFDFIKKIHDSNKEAKSLRKVIISKIILELLKNYEGLDEYDESEDKEKVDELRNENEKIIQDNIGDLKKLDSIFTDDYIKNEKLDELYINIIGKLITSKKFEDNDYISDIMIQLDMENIHLSNEMFEKLSKFLIESNLEEYAISKKEDLDNEKKINFYYILFKYVLKNPFFLYRNDFLIKTRKVIIELLRKIDVILFKIEGEKLKYTLQFFLDFSYNYYNYNYLRNELLTYYKGNMFEKKMEDINKIESMDENNKEDFLNQYFKEFKEAKLNNSQLGFINYLVKERFGEERTKDNFDQMVVKWNWIKKIFNDKKKNKLRADDCLSFIKYFNDVNNKESFNVIFNEDEETKQFIFEYLNSKISLYKDTDYSYSIPYYIINKSTFVFHINEKGKEPYINYEKIKYGFFNFEIEYEKIELIKENENFKKSEDKVLINNYNKFIDFLKLVEDELKKEFKYNYKLRISLDFNMEKKKNDDNVYNVSCIYTFSDPIKNEKSQFKEENIFINGTKSDGFKNLLSAINNESYKELKYQ
jgi:hypothetical protein